MTSFGLARWIQDRAAGLRVLASPRLATGRRRGRILRLDAARTACAPLRARFVRAIARRLESSGRSATCAGSSSFAEFGPRTVALHPRSKPRRSHTAKASASRRSESARPQRPTRGSSADAASRRPARAGRPVCRFELRLTRYAIRNRVRAASGSHAWGFGAATAVRTIQTGRHVPQLSECHVCGEPADRLGGFARQPRRDAGQPRPAEPCA